MGKETKFSKALKDRDLTPRRYSEISLTPYSTVEAWVRKGLGPKRSHAVILALYKEVPEARAYLEEKFPSKPPKKRGATFKPGESPPGARTRWDQIYEIARELYMKESESTDEGWLEIRHGAHTFADNERRFWRNKAISVWEERHGKKFKIGGGRKR
jgi:hypothetical protein